MSEPSQKNQLLNFIFILSKSTSNAVLFECANAITQLTTSPTAIKLAISNYLTLLGEQNDNNVKLIILNKFNALKTKYGKLLEDSVIDILNVLVDSSSNLLRKLALQLGAVDLASKRNIRDILGFMEKEFIRVKQLDDKDKET